MDLNCCATIQNDETMKTAIYLQTDLVLSSAINMSIVFLYVDKRR